MLTNPGKVTLCKVDVEKYVIETTCSLKGTKKNSTDTRRCVSSWALDSHTAIRTGFQDWGWLA